MPVARRVIPSQLVPDSQPTTAGSVEYAGVPSDRLLFALYDAEKSQKDHTSAVDGLCDIVKSLGDEMETLGKIIKVQGEAIEELTEAVKRLTEQLANKPGV